MQKDEKIQLIERLAGFLLQEDGRDGTQKALANILTRLDEMSDRLVTIEKELHERQDISLAAKSPTLTHPSLQKFEVPEVVEQFLPGTTIKACTFEPNGKPCDDCAMCSARGF